MNTLNKKQIRNAMGHKRYDHMVKMRKLAVKHNRCEEMQDGRCMYPHCGCLYGENGHINPVTGKE